MIFGRGIAKYVQEKDLVCGIRGLVGWGEACQMKQALSGVFTQSLLA